jgi:ParB family chromosome partitioning protein
MIKHKGLGRGLDALLGADRTEAPAPAAPVGPPQTLPLARLQAGRYQPRTRMDESALQELAASIAQHGMMQPIVVRALAPAAGAATGRGADATRYEIIAGERRFRAATIAGLTDVPVIVKDVPDELALALALIENIQREDLNPLEEAQAIRRLIDEFGYSHERASEAIGRSRSATSNLLRLLNLAEPVQTMLLAGDLDMGHARALLAVDRATQTMLANEVVQKRLSVRDTERLVSRAVSAHNASDPAAAPESVRAPALVQDRDIKRLQERVCEALGADVRIQPNRRGGGKLVIAFSGNEQFEGLLARLGVPLREE